MTNDQDEVIIDSTETNDESEEAEQTNDEKPEDQKVEKPIETPEAKQARLKRQLAQLEKKHGLKSDTSEKPKVSENKSEANLSAKDTFALLEAKVSTEDFDEVIDFANYRKVSVAEALKSPVLKAILSDKNEERQTAFATQTKGAKVSPKVTDEAIIEKARKGSFPDSDEEIARLAAAEHRAFINKRKK